MCCVLSLPPASKITKLAKDVRCAILLAYSISKQPTSVVMCVFAVVPKYTTLTLYAFPLFENHARGAACAASLLLFPKAQTQPRILPESSTCL
jgi:hypothetical protein